MVWSHQIVSSLWCLAVSQQNSVTTTRDDFHAWADDNKMVRSVEVYDDTEVGGGKGLVATRDLLPGEIALQVPRTVTIQTTGGEGWSGSLAAELCKLQREAALEGSEEAVSIDMGNGQSYTWKPFSWKPYFDYGLPKESPDSSARWTASQLQQLQNKTLTDESLDTAACRNSQYARFSNDLTSEEFSRALLLVCSRALQAGESSRILVPLLDNANHEAAEDGGGKFVVGSNSVVLFAGKFGAKKGEAVTLNYGSRTADEYLLTYGFVPSNCVGDTVAVVGAPNGVVSWSDCPHEDPQVRQTCLEMLQSSPTTLEEDEKTIEDYNGGFDAYRVALDYRRAKKKLLTSASCSK